MEFGWTQIAGMWPAVVGGVAGFLYNRFVGCKSGACPLTSNPWVSTLYGALMGALMISR